MIKSLYHIWSSKFFLIIKKLVLYFCNDANDWYCLPSSTSLGYTITWALRKQSDMSYLIRRPLGLIYLSEYFYKYSSIHISTQSQIADVKRNIIWKLTSISHTVVSSVPGFLLWFWIFFYNPLCWILLYPKSECWISQVYLQPVLSFSFVSLDSLICLHEFNFCIYEDHFQVPVSSLLPSEFKILFIHIISVLGYLNYCKSNILKTQLMIPQYFLPQSTVGLPTQLLMQEAWNPFLGNSPHIHETTKFSEFQLLIFFFFFWFLISLHLHWHFLT